MKQTGLMIVESFTYRNDIYERRVYGDGSFDWFIYSDNGFISVSEYDGRTKEHLESKYQNLSERYYASVDGVRMREEIPDQVEDVIDDIFGNI